VLSLLLKVVEGVDAGYGRSQRGGNGGNTDVCPVLLAVDDEAVNGCAKGLFDLSRVARKLDKEAAGADLRDLEAIGCQPLSDASMSAAAEPKRSPNCWGVSH
jgi:hypothetical protein